MKKQLITLLLIFWISNTYSQNFVSDSLMSIYIDSGIADQNFKAKGKYKDGIKVGKWVDYTFEFILTYKQRDENTVDESFSHLLIQSNGNFIDGEKNGPWSFNAVEEGSFKKYHIADVSYKNGERDGPVTMYYASGEKAATGSYENNLLQGNFTVYTKSGEVDRTFNLYHDKIEGELTYFYKSGKKKYLYNFVKGFRQGESLSYYENGTIKSKKKYINDTLQGSEIHYYPNGKTQEETIFINGDISSLKYYYESGQLWVNREYKTMNILIF